MIDIADLRIFVCTTPTNMNCSFDRLMGRAQEIFEQDPFSGHLFLFMNRNRNRLKILFWDHDGLAIFYKRLERPGGTGNGGRIRQEQLNAIRSLAPNPCHFHPFWCHWRLASFFQGRVYLTRRR